MLVFDKSLAIFIIIAIGLCGIPLSFWLLRGDKQRSLLERLVFGYTLGFLLVPALFVIESLAGIYFSQMLVYVNWLIVLIGGIALLAKDNALLPSKGFAIVPSWSWLVQICLLALMLSVALIGLSSSGGIIFELDPYYYLEGVKQVVLEGRNFQNDGSAWFPNSASHLGQPFWKYEMASHFALYNGQAPYSPYILAAVGGIQPAVIGALAVFFAFFLFRQMYNERVGLLAAGCLGFMPTMLIKFQGGDFQIEPYNIFALLFLFSAIFMYLSQPNGKSRFIILVIAYSTLLLGSNLSDLTVFVFSITLFLYSLQASFEDGEKSKEIRKSGLRLLAAVLAIILIVQCYWFVVSAGSILSTLSAMMKNSALFVGAYFAPVVLDWIFARAKLPYDKKTETFAKLAVLAVMVVGGLAIGLLFPMTSELFKAYVSFGAYRAPLERTIAEQAPGSEFYAGQFGFVASALSAVQGTDLFVSFFSALFQAFGLLNAIPTFLLNAAYAVFVWFMNNILGANFDLVQKGNSFMTFFLFFSMLFLAASFALAVLRKEAWPIQAMMVFPFIFSVSLVAFGKQKLAMYLGIALVFAIGAFWGEAERLFSSLLIHSKKKGAMGGIPASTVSSLKAASALLALSLVLLQFGSPAMFDLGAYSGTPGALYNSFAPQYGLRAMPLLLSSLTPRIYDSPVSALSSLQFYCQSAPQDPVCNLVNDWNNTASVPSRYFSYDFCARSLWLYPNRQPPPDMGLVFSYRCSFVSTYWLDSMEWLNKNMADDDRLISWWDYGHWTNFFAQKKTVLRNEHASLDMIGRTAYSYVHGTPKDLRDTMRAYGSRTALFDVEIIGGGTREQPTFGGKFGALNYLGCSYANKTNVNLMPSQSACEQQNIYEQVYVPLDAASQKRCVISESSQIAGIEGYVLSQGAQGQVQTAQYCLSEGIVGGQRRLMAYRLGSTDENGDLKLQRAIWGVVGNDGQTAVLQAIYTKDKIWPDASGQLTDGWADRTTKFYNSNLYSAFMNNELEGFDLVYSSPQIRIFRMKEEYYNSNR